MSAWLDTETKALLQRSPPDKLAPPEAGGFTLVLIEAGPDFKRLVRAVQRIGRAAVEQAEKILGKSCPQVIVHGLSHEDALLGQFEFVCCDAKAIFIADRVAEGASESYFEDLYSWLRDSHEFEEVSFELVSVPETEEGRRFLDQFLGWRRGDQCRFQEQFPLFERVMRKKARIMEHWARKTGAEVRLEGEEGIVGEGP